MRDSSSGDIPINTHLSRSKSHQPLRPSLGPGVGYEGASGPAVAISQDRIADTSFLEPIVDLLVQLDAVTPEEVQPTTIKSHSKVIKTKDTVHPRFVTEMLTGLLRAIGQPSDVARIYKHTRDDVLWKDALDPWRRCPSWLLLRVALQTSLKQKRVEEPHVRYKSFMLFFMAQVLRGALKVCLRSDTIFLMTAKITRRALKLGAMDGTAWLQYVATTTTDAQQELSRRWVLVEKHPDLFATQGSWDPSQLLFLSDTQLRLSTLRPYLAKVMARLASPPTHHPFYVGLWSTHLAMQFKLASTEFAFGLERKSGPFVPDRPGTLGGKLSR